MNHYADLGDYGDWVAVSPALGRGARTPDRVTVRRLVDAALRAGDGGPWSDETPRDVRVERRWRDDGLEGAKTMQRAAFTWLDENLI